MGKLFNSVINSRLTLYLSATNKLSQFQAAFRQQHNAVDHIFTLKSIINKYVTFGKNKVYAAFVDFKKAFDSVPHNLLLLKLLLLGIGGNFYQIIKNMYSGKCQTYVKTQEGISKPFVTKVGIKQGDNLSPTLFNIFIDDIVSYFHSSEKHNVNLNGTDVKCLMYADDLIILASSHTQLQQYLNNLNTYCMDWGLSINTKKTKIMIFQKRNRDDHCTFHFGNKPLEIVQLYKYLGITFQQNGRFKHAMEDLKNRSNKAMFKLSSILENASVRDSKLWLKMFDCTLRPILTYGCQVWSQEMLHVLSKPKLSLHDNFPFEKLHYRYVTYLLGVNRHTHSLTARAEVGRYPLSIYMFSQTIKYWASTLGQQGKLAHAALMEDIKLHVAGHGTLTSIVHFIYKSAYDQDVLTHYDPHVSRPNQLKLKCEKYLQGQYQTCFYDQQNRDEVSHRLKSYIDIKQDYTTETYLLLRMPLNITRPISRLRLSDHDLHVETGRYNKPKKTPFENRTCLHCRTTIEDQLHFMTTCPLYDKDRQELEAVYRRNHPDVTAKSNEHKYKLYIQPDSIAQTIATSKFIYNALNERKRRFLAYTT